jgi:hypothetical protein
MSDYIDCSLLYTLHAARRVIFAVRWDSFIFSFRSRRTLEDTFIPFDILIFWQKSCFVLSIGFTHPCLHIMQFRNFYIRRFFAPNWWRLRVFELAYIYMYDRTWDSWDEVRWRRWSFRSTGCSTNCSIFFIFRDYRLDKLECLQCLQGGFPFTVTPVEVVF